MTDLAAEIVLLCQKVELRTIAVIDAEYVVGDDEESEKARASFYREAAHQQTLIVESAGRVAQAVEDAQRTVE